MNEEALLARAKDLKWYGLIAHWDEMPTAHMGLLEQLVIWEGDERFNRSLQRRLYGAKLGTFKLLSDFDWHWPKKCDQEAIEEFLELDFIKSNTNLVLCGPNGVGKSTIARNIAHSAVINGYTALFITAGQMLNDLAAQDGDNALRRRIKYYTQPDVLVIDEVGYLSYSNRHADLLFEIVSRRYEKNPTIITTNKPFAEWNEIFPNASCVVSLIDRLVHRSEIISIEAESFRLKEAKEQSIKRKELRKRKSPKKEDF